VVGEGVSALVIAFSEAGFDGEPAVRVLMRLRLPEGATEIHARDLALRYLDIA
jgi:isocitrate lyase